MPVSVSEGGVASVHVRRKNAGELCLSSSVNKASPYLAYLSVSVSKEGVTSVSDRKGAWPLYLLVKKVWPLYLSASLKGHELCICLCQRIRCGLRFCQSDTLRLCVYHLYEEDMISASVSSNKTGVGSLSVSLKMACPLPSSLCEKGMAKSGHLSCFIYTNISYSVCFVSANIKVNTVYVSDFL